MDLKYMTQNDLDIKDFLTLIPREERNKALLNLALWGLVLLVVWLYLLETIVRYVKDWNTLPLKLVPEMWNTYRQHITLFLSLSFIFAIPKFIVELVGSYYPDKKLMSGGSGLGVIFLNFICSVGRLGMIRATTQVFLDQEPDDLVACCFRQTNYYRLKAYYFAELFFYLVPSSLALTTVLVPTFDLYLGPTLGPWVCLLGLLPLCLFIITSLAFVPQVAALEGEEGKLGFGRLLIRSWRLASRNRVRVCLSTVLINAGAGVSEMLPEIVVLPGLDLKRIILEPCRVIITTLLYLHCRCEKEKEARLDLAERLYGKGTETHLD